MHGCIHAIVLRAVAPCGTSSGGPARQAEMQSIHKAKIHRQAKLVPAPLSRHQTAWRHCRLPRRCSAPCVTRVAAPQQVDIQQQAGVETQQDAVREDFSPLTNVWARNAAQHGSLIATREPHRAGVQPTTYRELYQNMLDFGAGLQQLGLQAGERVSLFSEGSSRWIVADQGIMMCGAADAVRGALSPADELAYIVAHSGSSGLVVQDADTLHKVWPLLQQATRDALRFVVILWGDQQGSSNGSSRPTTPTSQQQSEHPSAATAADAPACPVLTYQQVLAQGVQARRGTEFQPHHSRRSDLATLVYTSGTTGHPKGVMLTHGNLMYQMDHFGSVLQVLPGDTTLSLLPPWHIYQRTVSYYLLSVGCQEVFSNIRSFAKDLTAYPPDHFICVPLVLDTLYNKVMAKLKAESGPKKVVVGALLAASQAYVLAARTVSGMSLAHAQAPPTPLQLVWAQVMAALLRPLHQLAGKLVFSKVRAALGVRKTVVSGGGSLAAHLDVFFEMLGLPLLNGWGLTETSPVLACRSGNDPLENIRGTVGHPLPGTLIRVVDPVTLQPVPDGQQGLLLAQGPGVMAGYWQDPAATSKALFDGWFDTGDLGWIAPYGVPSSRMGGHIVLTGRAKDTIVLSSGKNIEPQPIEDAVACSSYIKHIILVGQDKRELGALVFPDEDYLATAASPAAAGDAPGSSTAPSSSAAASSNGAVAGVGVLAGGALEEVLFKEVSRLNSGRPDYHPEDHIAHIKVIRQPLSVDDGTLTRTMKARRPAIFAQHAATLQDLLHQLR